MHDPYLDTVLHVARRAAVAGGDILLRSFGDVAIRQKQSHNLVTQADLDSEACISEMIGQAFPEHGILREESASTGTLADPHIWIVDPLDGTNNYAHGIPHYSVSIGYARHGQVLVGVVYDPTRGEMYAAIRGTGAWLNDRPIRVSTRPTIRDSIVTTGFYYDRGNMMERTLEAVKRLFTNQVRGIRRTGGAALDLCWVAGGRFDGFFEYQLAPWDYAAGQLIVAEAGGRCADRDGVPLQLDSGSIIAANGHVFDELTSLVRWQ